MAIKYYPNRVFRALLPPVDVIMSRDTVKTLSGVSDLSGGALDETLSPFRDWRIVGLRFDFDSATGRNWSAKVVGGRSILENLNDFLWFQHPNTLPQKITLDAGFYTGTELATQLTTQLDANTAFSDLGLTFTVTYDATAGTYDISPSSGTIKYWEENTMGRLPERYSIAGHLFGFNVTTSFLATITSDTVVAGLDAEAFIIDETSDTDLSRYISDPFTLSLDQAIRVEADSVAVVMDYAIDYQELPRA
jgi:hypothetical protein